jgi:hypothetical protein
MSWLQTYLFFRLLAGLGRATTKEAANVGRHLKELVHIQQYRGLSATTTREQWVELDVAVVDAAKWCRQLRANASRCH